MHTWLVLAHVLGAFFFVAAHGVSMFASFGMRRAPSRERQLALLQLSGIGANISYIGLLLLLAGGIAAGFTGNWWGSGWIWTAIALLVVILAVMYSVATPFYGRMRAAAGLPGYADRAASFKPPATPDDLDQLAQSNRPMWLALVGGIGLIAIIYLMIVKPF